MERFSLVDPAASGTDPASFQGKAGASAKPPELSREITRKIAGSMGMVMGMAPRVGASGAGCAHASLARYASRSVRRRHMDEMDLPTLDTSPLTRHSVPSGHAVGAYACETLLHWLEAEEEERVRIGAHRLHAIGHQDDMNGDAGGRDGYPAVRCMGGISSSCSLETLNRMIENCTRSSPSRRLIEFRCGYDTGLIGSSRSCLARIP